MRRNQATLEKMGCYQLNKKMNGISARMLLREVILRLEILSSRLKGLKAGKDVWLSLLFSCQVVSSSWTAACQASLSLTISWSLSKFTPTGLPSGSDGKEDICKNIQLLRDSLNCIAPYWLGSPISSQGSFSNILFLACWSAAWLGLFYPQQIESCLYCITEPIWLNVQFGRYHRIMWMFRFSKNILIFTHLPSQHIWQRGHSVP